MDPTLAYVCRRMVIAYICPLDFLCVSGDYYLGAECVVFITQLFGAKHI